MPPKIVDHKDLDRAKYFVRICDLLFPDLSNQAIGERLGGYPEGTIRNWKKGGSIGNTAVYHLGKMGVSMEYLFRGEGEIFLSRTPGKNVPIKEVDPKLLALCEIFGKFQTVLNSYQLDAISGKITLEQFGDIMQAAIRGIKKVEHDNQLSRTDSLTG